MTQDQIIERVAAHLSYTYCEGDPSPDNFDRDAATAIVDMLGPKELAWLGGGSRYHSLCRSYAIVLLAEHRRSTYRLLGASLHTQYVGDFTGGDALEAAKAAAQAHHEEQHWKRTRIWEDE